MVVYSHSCTSSARCEYSFRQVSQPLFASVLAPPKALAAFCQGPVETFRLQRLLYCMCSGCQARASLSVPRAMATAASSGNYSGATIASSSQAILQPEDFGQ